MKTADRSVSTLDRNRRRPVSHGRFAATAAVAALGSALLAVPGTAGAATTFRAGDVGFSIPTAKGSTWVYGDSWVNGRFVRNAMTLNGAYAGTIPSGTTRTWMWPGAPFRTPTGRIAMYGGEFTSTGTGGSWGFKLTNPFRAEFDPARASAATVKRLAPGGILWSASSVHDSQGPIVYGVDSNHRAHAGRPQADGSVLDVGTMGGTISNQFTVLKEPAGKWWLVGQLPFLSRRVVAYPLSGPTGKVTGSALKLITLPDPGSTRWTYAATIHTDYAGLLTWAVNGTGAGTPYGLQKSANFWPYTLYWARAAAAKTTTARTAGTASHRTARAADSAKLKINNGKGWGRLKSLEDDSTPGITGPDTVLMWASERQKELEQELARNQHNSTDSDWLGPLPEPLGEGMAPGAGSPSTWEFRGTNPEQPVGEDSDKARDSFLVPATLKGWKAQQEAAKAAIAAAAAELKAASDHLKALVEEQKAAEKAAKAAEKLAEARRKAAEDAGTENEDESKQAEREAEAAKQAAEQAIEQAKQQLEAAKQTAERAKANAEKASRKANGNGRASWD